MKGTLNVARGLKLPHEAVTQTFAILAVRGAGKTYALLVMAEEMIAAGMPVVVADPVGVCWGLRSKYPVVIFGGDHGDVPLEPNAGELIAEWVVKNRQPCVLDMSLMRKGEQVRFMAAFAEMLYRKNRQPLHVMLDEADSFAPQKPGRDQTRMLGALEDLVKKGRARGIGCTMATQRAAVLNKNVLTQIEALVCLRTTSPQDRKAVEGWIEANASDEDRSKFLSDLPKLPIGHAWFWSPGWLQVFKRIVVRKKYSFDSSATPKMGRRKLQPPKRMTKVKLEALHKQMKETIERKNEEDPKILRSRITKLQATIHSLETELEHVKKKASIKVPVLKDSQLTELKEAVDMVSFAAKDLKESAQLKEAVDMVSFAAKDLKESVQLVQQKTNNGSPQPWPQKTIPKNVVRNFDLGLDKNLPKCEHAILSVLCQYPEGKKKVAVALISGYSHKSGGFNNALSKLRTSGYIEGRGELRATEAGKAALGSFETLPTGKKLLDYWCNRLGKCERAILRELYAADGVDKHTLAELTQYSPTSGGFNNALSKLRTLELIEGRGEILLSNVFLSL